MEATLMKAINAYAERDWLKAQGFKWTDAAWIKETHDKAELEAVRNYSRGRFKLSSWPAAYSEEDWLDRVERKQQIERIEAQRALVGKMDVSVEEQQKFYAPGHSKLNAPKSYARYAKAPFTGHEPSGCRMSGDEGGPER